MQKLFKTDSQWRELLSEEQYLVTRKKGTKASFCEIFYAHNQAGIYHCTCGDLPSFSSEEKFNSGTGWLSFLKPPI